MSNRKRMRASWLAALALAALALFVPAVLPADEPAPEAVEPPPLVEVGMPAALEIAPGEIALVGPRSRRQLVVTGIYGDQVRDLTRACQYASSDPNIAVVEGSVVLPRGNGQAQVTATVGSLQATVSVTVSSMETPQPVSFHNDVIAALSKAGCSMGACHGAPSGKNGFRLSLRGYDPAMDFETLTHEIAARRTNPMEPEASLILRKPLMQVPHGGGRRLTEGDVSYTILRDWIAQGMRQDPEGTPTVQRIEVFPERRVLHAPAASQQLQVTAYFSDGSVRDITDIAVYSSSDEGVATVTESGELYKQGRGESAILVRYLDRMTTSHVMFLEDVPGFVWNNPPENNFIDTLVFDKLELLQILPAELCTDEEFVRRAYLDAIGKLPTSDEVREFLANPDRAALIDRLLARDEYADLWALRWGDVLRSNRTTVGEAGIHKYQTWIHNAIRDDLPMDQFARELLTAEGSAYANPAANYWRVCRDQDDSVETTAQLFLGVRIQCAKCHNHPFEVWTQDNYYGLGAFFTRVGRRPGTEEGDEVIFVTSAGESTQPRTGRQMAPWLPGVGEAEIPPGTDRREVFAEWLTSSENRFFARSIVNRVWGHLMGRGIVDPVDDFRDSNPPSNEELLDALAQDFIDHGYSMRHLVRTIMNSRVYQLSSRTNEFNENDERYFSHATTRLLQAEQLLDAICQVTGVPEQFPGLPMGTRAVELPDPRIDNYFLKIFGQPQREMACECERSNESNLSQALQMINGPVVHDKLRADNGRINQMIVAGRSDAEIVEELYLASLCRMPTAEEIAAINEHIATSDDRRRALEDVGWALLNAKEFLFQH